ncbi:DUF4189 domain-containing protein [Nocardia sp. NPDC057353]|uniref:DUF4189 domain-containing protein n=1 Tax=Nocardia sp. NPDC057353 TaxID=3346104 RepID=UPI003629831E
MSFMGKVGFAVAAGALAVGSVLGAGSAHAAGQYAAIAVSNSTLYYGVSVDLPNYDEAYRVALEQCGESDCEILVAWANGCGALVASEDGYAGKSGPDRASAERAAYDLIAQITPTAVLANTGSAQLSGAHIVDVVCTSNAR